VSSNIIGTYRDSVKSYISSNNRGMYPDSVISIQLLARAPDTCHYWDLFVLFIRTRRRYLGISKDDSPLLLSPYRPTIFVTVVPHSML